MTPVRPEYLLLPRKSMNLLPAIKIQTELCHVMHHEEEPCQVRRSERRRARPKPPADTKRPIKNQRGRGPPVVLGNTILDGPVCQRSFLVPPRVQGILHYGGTTNAFAMTSYKADGDNLGGPLTIYKVQGVVYHSAGSHLPQSEDPQRKYLQLY